VKEFELDVRGEICPYPLTETRKTMAELKVGDRLVVWVDYPLAVDNVPRWVENSGNKLIGVEKTGASEWKIVIEKTVA